MNLKDTWKRAGAAFAAWNQPNRTMAEHRRSMKRTGLVAAFAAVASGVAFATNHPVLGQGLGLIAISSGGMTVGSYMLAKLTDGHEKYKQDQKPPER